MTVKERWLAALKMQPVDRLPFWPKLNGSYLPAQTSDFRNCTLPEIHQYVGSDPHGFIAPCYAEKRSATSVETITRGDEQVIRFISPNGTVETRQHFDEPSCSWHPVGFPVTDRESLQIMTRMYADTDVVLDRDILAENIKKYENFNDNSFTAASIGVSPLMWFVEHLAGVANAHLLIADFPDEVAALFAAMHHTTVKKAEILAAHSPADALYMIENTSTTLISPQQYHQYCLKHITDYGSIVTEADKILILHMCGHLKALLPDLATVPARAFEAFTSPTLGNTTLLDGRLTCPDKCLIGGTNAMLWMKTPEEIIARLEKDLTCLPHHRGIIVTSAGVMPPGCAPDTIRQVCDWVKEFKLSEN